MYMTPYPELKRIHHKFAWSGDAISTNPSTNTWAIAGKTFSLNDPADPIPLQDTTQPRWDVQPIGFDEYAAIYESYYTAASLFTIHFRRSIPGVIPGTSDVPEDPTTGEFIGIVGYYYSTEDDVGTLMTEVNKINQGGGTLDAGNAWQQFINHDRVVWRRIDATHELDKGVRMQFQYTRPKFLRGASTSLTAGGIFRADFHETAVGAWNGTKFVSPTEKAFITPFIMLQYRDYGSESKTGPNINFTVNYDVQLSYNVTWSTLKDNVKKDTSLFNDPQDD